MYEAIRLRTFQIHVCRTYTDTCVDVYVRTSEHVGSGPVTRQVTSSNIPVSLQCLITDYCRYSLILFDHIYKCFIQRRCRSASTCRMMVNTELENIWKEAALTLLVDAVFIFSV